MLADRSYYRIMLGPRSIYAQQCFDGSWIGGGNDIAQDLTSNLTENWKDFNAKFIPIYLQARPEKSKVTAGLICGMLYTICKGIKQGDIVLCPDGKGTYWVGKIVSDYFYVPHEVLPHRRRVEWLPVKIARADMSESLRNSTGSIGTVSNITKHASEIEKFIVGEGEPTIIAVDAAIEDPTVFGLEKHLEDFLVQNWAATELGKNYDIFEDDGEVVGQQYPTDTGAIDILAISKDKKELLVVELKKGRASDNVIGQIQRYMGFILDERADSGQSVRGCIVALEDDVRMRRALRVTNNIDFYRYQVNFKLFRA